MNKQEILEAIRRIAAESGGKAPGSQRLGSEIGLRKSDWYPNLWLRWSDAQREAGCQTNTMSTSFADEHLITKYIELIRELGRFPIDGELRVKRLKDRTFPNSGAFSKLGSKSERARRIVEYCSSHQGCDDVLALSSDVPETQPRGDRISITVDFAPGYVYLVKHGSRREYKIGRTNNPIRREGEVRLQLPEKLQPVHSIKTDDPAGIENYWHSRFAQKRKEGEWFSLSAEDVRAFKRWRRIY